MMPQLVTMTGWEGSSVGLWGYLGLFRVSAKEATYPHMQGHNNNLMLNLDLIRYTVPPRMFHHRRTYCSLKRPSIEVYFVFFLLYIFCILGLKSTVEVFHEEYISM